MAHKTRYTMPPFSLATAHSATAATRGMHLPLVRLHGKDGATSAGDLRGRASATRRSTAGDTHMPAAYAAARARWRHLLAQFCHAGPGVQNAKTAARAARRAWQGIARGGAGRSTTTQQRHVGALNSRWGGAYHYRTYYVRRQNTTHGIFKRTRVWHKRRAACAPPHDTTTTYGAVSLFTIHTWRAPARRTSGRARIVRQANRGGQRQEGRAQHPRAYTASRQHGCTAKTPPAASQQTVWHTATFQRTSAAARYTLPARTRTTSAFCRAIPCCTWRAGCGRTRKKHRYISLPPTVKYRLVTHTRRRRAAAAGIGGVAGQATQKNRQVPLTACERPCDRWDGHAYGGAYFTTLRARHYQPQ